MSSIVLSATYGAPAGEPVEHAEHADDLPAGLLQRGDRRQRRAARRDDVLDDHAAVLLAQWRTLDPPLKAVMLGLLADEEPPRTRAPGERRAGDRIGAHRPPAH